jgi:hypothetical protein
MLKVAKEWEDRINFVVPKVGVISMVIKVANGMVFWC